jgi:CRISPR-associated protein Csc2
MSLSVLFLPMEKLLVICAGHRQYMIAFPMKYYTRINPLDEDLVMEKATEAIQVLMAEEFIVHTDFIGENFQPLLTEVKTLTGTEAGILSILNQADKEAKDYAKKHIAEKKPAAKKP